MRNGFLGSLAIALVSGWAWGQNPYPPSPYPPVQVPMYGPDKLPGPPPGYPPVQVPMYGNGGNPPPIVPGYSPQGIPGMPPPYATGLPSNLPYALPRPAQPFASGPVAPGPYRQTGPPPGFPPPGPPAEPMVVMPDGPPIERRWFPKHEEECPKVYPLPGTPLIEEGTPVQCDPGCLDCPQNCPPGNCFYGSGEFLLYWARKQLAPALVSVGPNGAAGSTVVGDPDLTFENQQRYGGRFSLGYWLNCKQTIGLETTFMFLAPRTSTYFASSTGTTQLDRPFFDTSLGTESQVTVAGGAAGTPGNVQIASQNFQFGGDVSLRFEFLRRPCWHLDWLFGFKYYELDESLNVTANSTSTGVSTTTSDRFTTTNTHLGAMIGLDYEAHLGPVFLELWGKFSLGQNAQHVTIAGDTTTGGVTTNGGFLAQPSNIGSYSQGRLDILPEAGFNLGFKISDHCRIMGGYNILYLNNVARPGGSIDRNINPTQVGNPGPTFAFHDHTYWVQGLSAGFEFRY